MYDEALAGRIRRQLATALVDERKMFGGLAFMVEGHMACGVVGSALMVRVGPAAYENALSRPEARPMDFTGRPMTGMVYVDPAGLDDEGVLGWVNLGLAFARSLPPKRAKR